ncbi:MAG: site-specific integrase [Candidatus Limivicinus sp.]
MTAVYLCVLPLDLYCRQYYNKDTTGGERSKTSDKWRAIVNLLIVTGCRRGEIAALKWSKVDYESGKITVDATLLYDPKKGIYENATKTGDVRYLKLPAETMALLKEYRRWWVELRFKNGDRWAGTDYLFVQNDGKPINPDSISAWVSDFSKRHELSHINPHAFRHTVASVLINNGQDIVTVSRRLGHSRTSTTLDIYSHMIDEADAEASECIADVLLRRQA